MRCAKESLLWTIPQSDTSSVGGHGARRHVSGGSWTVHSKGLLEAADCTAPLRTTRNGHLNTCCFIERALPA